MAIPNPPVTPNSSKLHYLLYDDTGTNAAAIWHSVKQITVNAETVGVAHVGTHALGGSLGGTDAAVVIAGTDSGTIRALAVNADGEVGIHDGGNSLTVDGTVSITGAVDTELPAAAALADATANPTVPGVGGFLHGYNGTTWDRVRTANTGRLQVDVVTGGGGTSYVEDAASAGGESLILAGAVRQDTISSSTTTDGDYAYLKVTSTGRLYTSATIDGALPAGTNNIGDVDVLTVPAPLSTTGGGTEATALRVTLANDSTGLVSVDDNGGSLTVDGTVSISGAVDTELPAAAALADATANPTVPAVGSHLMGYNGTTWDRVRTANTGRLQVDIVSGGSSGAQYTEGDIDTTITGTAIMWEDAGDTLQAVSAAKPLPISDAGGSLTVDGTVAVSGTVTVDTELPAAAALADATANPTVPGVGGFLLGYNGTTWDRIRTANTGRLQVDVITGGTGGAQYVEDVASAGGESLTLAGAVRQDTISSSTSLDGDYAYLKVTAAGRLYTSATVDTALPAGTNNIGDVDVLTVPAPLSTAGGGTEATALRVTIANDSTGVLSVDDNGGSLTVDGTVAVTNADITTIAGAIRAEDAASLDGHTGIGALAVRKATPANTSGTDGDYEFLQMSAGRLWASATIDTALPAGTNNIGDVDILTVPAPLSTTGGGTEATALRVTIASDSTGVVSVDDNGGSLTVDGTLTVNTGTGFPTAYTEDAASPADPTGTATILRRRDTPTDNDNQLASEVTTAADWVAGNCDEYGAQFVSLTGRGRSVVGLDADNRAFVFVGGASVGATIADEALPIQAFTDNPAWDHYVCVGLISQSTGQAAVVVGAEPAITDLGLVTRPIGVGACDTSTLSSTVSVGVTATALPATALTGRKRLVIQNKSTTQSIFVGGSGVTTSNGMEIPVSWSQPLEAGEANNVFAIVASGTADVRVLELS